MKPFLVALAVLAVCAVGLSSSSARGDDDPALPDGGSIVTPLDGGSTVTVDLGGRGAWNMVLRAEGAQSTRYVTCAADTISFSGGSAIHSCKAASHNELLDYDRTLDVPMNQSGGWPTKRYMSFSTDDGGIPFVKVQVFH